MKKRPKELLLAGLSVLMVGSMLTGCNSATKAMVEQMNSGADCTVTVEGTAGGGTEALEWIELDQLQTHSKMRRNFDDAFGIVKFDQGSKNGVIYSDLDGNWTGNNTLYNAFKNRTFVEDYWGNGKVKSTIAGYAREEFTDVNSDDVAVVAGMNAYFNILPSQTDGTSGLSASATRAEAMGAIFRADTPVENVEANAEFAAAVGDNEWNIYAQELASSSWLDYTNGSLNSDNYNGYITKAEFVYMLMNRYFPEQMNTSIGNITGKTASEKMGFISKNKETGEITYGHAWQAYVLQATLTDEKASPQEELNAALQLASSLGIIQSTSDWRSPLMKYDVVNMIIKTYEVMGESQGYSVAVRNGANSGEQLFESSDLAEMRAQINELNEQALQSALENNPDDAATTVVEQVDVTDTDDMLEVYGDEFNLTDEEYKEAISALEGFTIEECDKYMVVNSSVNVRVGPSTEFRVVTSLAYKEIVHVTGRCAETGWYRIATPEGKIAYVCGAYMTDIVEDSTESGSTGTVTTVTAEEAAALAGVDSSGTTEESTEEVESSEETASEEVADETSTEE